MQGGVTGSTFIVNERYRTTIPKTSELKKHAGVLRQYLALCVGMVAIYAVMGATELQRAGKVHFATHFDHPSSLPFRLSLLPTPFGFRSGVHAIRARLVVVTILARERFTGSHRRERVYPNEDSPLPRLVVTATEKER